MRKWKPELETPLVCMKTSWLQWKDANWSGTGTPHDHLDWPRISYREQFKGWDEEADRGNDGKTTSNSGMTLNGIYDYGKPRTTRSGGSYPAICLALIWSVLGLVYLAIILSLGEIQSLICNFYLSVAACTIVWADPSLRHTGMLLGR